MLVKIGKYKYWFGPYQLADLLCFWVEKEVDDYGFKSKPKWVHHLGEWLAYGSIEPEAKAGDIIKWSLDRPDTLLSKLLSWVYSKQKRIIEVHIDPWDTCSMDHTLSLVILPLLKQLKESRHGWGLIDLTDVHKELHGNVDEQHQQGWIWILDEMIFAFESKMDDSWEKQFVTGVSDLQWRKLENGTLK